MPDPIETLYVDLGLKSDTFKKQVTEEMNNAVQNINKAGQGAQQAVQHFTSMGNSLASTAKQAIGLGNVLANTFQTVLANIFLGGNPLQALVSGIGAANAGLQGMASQGSGAAGALAAISGPVALVATGLSAVMAAGSGVIGIFERIAASGEAPFAVLAARVETLGVGLDVIAKNAEVGLGTVREKMQGLQATGITTRESIESLMQFLSQKLPIDNIEKLARAGQNVAVAYGKNSTETFNRFVYAIMTGNAEVLRLVGINKTATMMQTEFAQAVGKSVTQLADLERKQAIVEGILKASAGYTGLYEKSMESLGKRIGSLPRYLEEAKLAFEQTLIPLLATVVELTEKFWKGMQRVFVQMTQVADESGKMKDVPLISPMGNYQLTEFSQKLYDISTVIADNLLPIGEILIAQLFKMGDLFNAAEMFVTPLIGVFKELAETVALFGDASATAFEIFLRARDDMNKGGYNEPRTIEQFWESFGEYAIRANAMALQGIYLVIGALDAMNKKIKGEVAPSFDEIRKVAHDAAQAAVDDIVVVETAQESMYEKAMAAGKRTRELYQIVTGESPYLMTEEDMKKAGFKEGQGPTSKAYEEWLAKEQEKYLKETGGEYMKTPPKGQPTFEQFVYKEYETKKGKEEEDARTAAQRTKFQTDAIKKFADMMDAATKSEDRAADNFKEAADRFNAQVKEQEGKLLESLNKGLARLQKDYAKQVVNLREQAAESEKELEKQAGEARVEAQVEIQDRQTKLKQDFLFQMKRMEEDYLMNLEDAVGARDARKVLELMRQHKINQTRAKEDFDRRGADQSESDKKSLDNIDKREQEAKDRIKKSLDKQLVDLKTNLAEREDELRENYNEQLRELNKNADKQRADMNRNYKKQLDDLKKANNDRMIEMVKGWADANLITKDQAIVMLKNLDAYYGAKGTITTLLSDFIERVKRNANLNIVISATTSGELTGAAAAATGDSAALYKSIKSYRGRASGGLTIADTPTTVMFGEGGREANFSMPMGPGDWTIPQLQNMGGGKGEDRMSLDVRIRADGNFSPQFEDGLYSRLADTIMKAAGQRIRITKG